MTQGLFHRVFRRVAFARHDRVLHVLALLVFHFQRAPIGSDHFHFQFAVGAVQLGIGGVVGEVVLVADVADDVVKNLRQFA